MVTQIPTQKSWNIRSHNLQFEKLGEHANRVLDFVQINKGFTSKYVIDNFKFD